MEVFRRLADLTVSLMPDMGYLGQLEKTPQNLWLMIFSDEGDLALIS